MARTSDKTPDAAGPPASVASALDGVIRAAIAEQGGWLAFDRFMALALYAPRLGYYANHRRKFGAMPSSGSDFVTAPELSPWFARALAVQVAQALAAGGSDRVMEFGAGSGALASGLLDALDCAGVALARYLIVDLSGTLRERQQARLARFGERGAVAGRAARSLRWRAAGQRAARRDAGAAAVLRRPGLVSSAGWRSARPTTRAGSSGRTGRLRCGRRSTLQVWRRWCPAASPRSTARPRPSSRRWPACCGAGVAIFIDYGFPEAEYYLPQRHGGTLMCHQAHRADGDPLVEVGAKDITPMSTSAPSRWPGRTPGWT